jgi:hypothetical protein
LSTEEDLVAHLENKQTQDPTLQISSVQACDNPSTDANDVPSEASLDIVQCAVCEMPCFDFMKCSVCNKFAHELCSKSGHLYSGCHRPELKKFVGVRKMGVVRATSACALWALYWTIINSYSYKGQSTIKCFSSSISPLEQFVHFLSEYYQHLPKMV